MIRRVLCAWFAASVLGGCYAQTRITSLERELASDLSSGRLEEAEHPTRQIRQVAERAYGPNDVDALRARSESAQIYGSWGQTDRAVQLADALAHDIAGSGADDRRLVLPQLAKAEAYLCTQQWRNAEAVLDQSAQTCSKPREEGKLDDCHRFADWQLPVLFSKAGAWRKSVEMQARLAARQIEIDDRHLEASGLTVVGRYYTRGGLYADAVPYFRKCIELSSPRYDRQLAPARKVWSTPGSDVEIFVRDAAHAFDSQAPRCVEDMIEASRKLGDEKEADRLMRWQDELWSRGPDLERQLIDSLHAADDAWHDNVLTSKRAHDLAFYYAGKRRFADALPVFDLAIRLLERAPSTDAPLDGCLDAPLLVHLLIEQGESYEGAGRSSDAVATYRRAETVAASSLPPGHEWRLDAAAQLARALAHEGSPGEAEKAWRRYLALVEQERGRDHADYAFGLTGLAPILAASGHPADAARSREEAKRIWNDYAETAATSAQRARSAPLLSRPSPAN